MAIGTPSLKSNAGAATTSVTTGSFTPTAGELLLAMCGSRAGGAAVPTISDSLGGIWTLVTGTDIDAGNVCGAVYKQQVGASPAAMTVTASDGGAVTMSLGVIGITGASHAIRNIGTDTDTAGDPSVTMSAVGTGSAGIAFHVQNAGSAPTGTPSGYTSLFNSQPATNIRHSGFYDLSSPGLTATWASTGTDAIAYLLEIVDAPTSTITVGATQTTDGPDGSTTSLSCSVNVGSARSGRNLSILTQSVGSNVLTGGALDPSGDNVAITILDTIAQGDAVSCAACVAVPDSMSGTVTLDLTSSGMFTMRGNIRVIDGANPTPFDAQATGETGFPFRPAVNHGTAPTGAIVHSGTKSFSVAGFGSFTAPDFYTDSAITQQTNDTSGTAYYSDGAVIATPGAWSVTNTGTITTTMASIMWEPADAGTGEIVGSTDVAFTTAGILRGTGALVGASTVAFTTAGIPRATGTLIGSSTPTFTTAGILVGSGVLTGASTVAFTTSGAALAIGALVGSSSPAFTSSGTLFGSGVLTGATTLTFSLSGSVVQPSYIIGSSNPAFSTAGILRGTGRLIGSSNLSFTTTGFFSTTSFMAGSCTLSFETSGELGTVLIIYGETSGTNPDSPYGTSTASGVLYGFTSGTNPNPIYEEN